MNSALAELSRVGYRLLFSHFAKITFEHINGFRAQTFPSGWVPNKMDLEFAIKYKWQTRFLTASTPCRFVHTYFYLPIQNYTAEVNCLVALHELYKYINKYYDQVSIKKENTVWWLWCAGVVICSHQISLKCWRNATWWVYIQCT